MKRSIVSIAATFGFLLFITAATQGQVTGGRVSGTVVDGNGTAVPNATITLRSETSNEMLETQSTAGGSYAFPNVPVGEYMIRIEGGGLQTTTRRIKVLPNQESSVAMTMAPADENDKIKAASDQALIQPNNSQLGISFERQQVLDLPIFGNQNTLGLLSPNAVPVPSGVFGAGGSIGGTRPSANHFQIDGTENNDPFVTGPSASVIQDAIEGFTLLNNNYKAEFGPGAGGQFNTITKSGDNILHGSGFIYAQSERFNAASTRESELLQNGFITKKLRQRNMRYGGTVGGPMIKDKLFFFGAFQREEFDRDLNPLFGTVPPSVLSRFKDNQFQINVDHLPNTKDQFHYRFSFDRFRTRGVGNTTAAFNDLFQFDSRLFSATWVRTFSPALINDLRLAYRRANADSPLVDPGARNFGTFTLRPNLTPIPRGALFGQVGNLPQEGADNSYQVYDALNWNRGKHSFKFGGEFRRLLTSDLVPFFDPRGNLAGRTFSGNQYKFYGFAQDDWKITPNLVLNLGLRYEYVTLPRDASLQTLNSVASVPGTLEFGEPETDKNNFAPRVGFAYSPGFQNRYTRLLFGERGKSVIRGGFSIAYSELPQDLILAQLPPQFFPSLIPLTTARDARSATFSFIPRQTSPYTMAFTLGIQRELTPSTAIEIRYLGTRSRKLPVEVDLNGGVVNVNNLAIPTFFSQPTAAQLAGRPSLLTLISRSDVLTGPLDAFGFFDVTSFQPIGNSQYDAGSISVMRRFSRGMAFTAAYTFSRTTDNFSSETSGSLYPARPQNSLNVNDDRARSTLDIPHRFAASFNYDITLFDKDSNWYLKTLLSGFQLNAIFQAQSGQLVSPLSGIDSNLNFDSTGDRTIFNPSGVAGTGSAVRAVNSNGQTVALGDPSTVAYVALNPNARFVQAGFLARATAGRNTLRTDGFNRTDMVFLKNFRFIEDRFNFQVGAEVFNLFNQRIRTLEGIDIRNSDFANVESPFFNDFSVGDFGGRTVQLRGKLIF